MKTKVSVIALVFWGRRLATHVDDDNDDNNNCCFIIEEKWNELPHGDKMYTNEKHLPCCSKKILSDWHKQIFDPLV